MLFVPQLPSLSYSSRKVCRLALSTSRHSYKQLQIVLSRCRLRKLSVLILERPTRTWLTLKILHGRGCWPTSHSSCVGVWQNDRVEIIANDQGNRTTPSYVSFSDNERLIGDAAKNQVAMNPHNTYVCFHFRVFWTWYWLDLFFFSVFDAKRLIGRKFEDAEVQSDLKHFPFKVFSKGGKPYIKVEYRGEEKEFVRFPSFIILSNLRLMHFLF